jgi:hypothetical protein
MNMQEQPQRNGWFHSRVTTWILLGFLTIGAFFLLTEHTAHVWGLLPYALLLLCPLMMLFMHGGHGGHGKHSEHAEENRAHTPNQPPEGGQS